MQLFAIYWHNLAMMHHETWKSSVVNVDGLWLGRGGGGPPTDVGIANRDCVSRSPSLTIPSSKCSYTVKNLKITETLHAVTKAIIYT